MSALRRVSPLTRKSLFTAGVAGIALSLGAFAAPSQAASQNIEGVELTWGLNAESGAGAYNGSCNFISAGVAGNTGSSRAWTEADGFHKSTDGNVSVVKDGRDSSTIAATWANKCQTGAGTPVSPSGTAALSNNKIVLSEGTGTVDPATGTATISWTGSFTSVFYGGLTYWSASNPVLSVKADGTATLKATASGYGADQNDTTVWTSIPATEVTLANLKNVEIDADGFSITPEYLGVKAPAGVPQVLGGATAGAFPADFLEFQAATGTQPYWYSSGGAADAKKVASALSVAWVVDNVEPPIEPEVPGDDKNVDLDVKVPEVAVEPEPEIFSWTVATNNASLATATQQAGGTFGATGALPGIKVTDTRATSGGWSLSGKASEFTSSAGKFTGGALGWDPVVTNPTGPIVEGAAVKANNPGLAGSQSLASTTGINTAADINASLELVAPASAKAGDYTSRVTLTLISK